MLATLERPDSITTALTLDEPFYRSQKIEEDLLRDLKTLAAFHKMDVNVYISILFRPLVDAKMDEMAKEISERKEQVRGERDDPHRHHRRKS